jgi:ADP-ribose pyrophosphatase
MKDHGPWKIVASRDVYRDRWLKVRKDDVIRPDGQRGTYSVATLLSGVCVLAVDEQHNAYLTEEFHYGVGRITLEGVSGGIEPGEAPLETARRELAEELGILAKKWTNLGCVDPLTGSVVSPTQIFLAQDLAFTASKPEGSELIRRIRMPMLDVVEAVLNSQITHGPTCVLILKAAWQLAQFSP